MIRRIVLACSLLILSATGSAEEVTIRAIPQDTLLDYLAGKEVFQLIDARSTPEYQAGHIHNAINIPHDADLSRAELPEDSDAPLVVYCKSGVRALTLKERLDDMGYSNVRVLGPSQIMWGDDLPVFDCGGEARDSRVLKTSESAPVAAMEPATLEASSEERGGKQ